MKLTVEFKPQYPNDGYCEIKFDTLEFSIPDKEYELLTTKELEDKILSEDYGKLPYNPNFQDRVDSEPMQPTTESWDVNFDWDWYWYENPIEISDIVEESK